MNAWVKKHHKEYDLSTNRYNDVLLPNNKTLQPCDEQLGAIFHSGEQQSTTAHIVDMINNAQQTAILISFLFASQPIEAAILRAAERGVRVYLLTASENTLDSDPRDGDDFGHKVQQQHKTMLDKLAGKILLRSAPSFHTKLVLTDGDMVSASGLLLTSNLTEAALQRNEEMAVILTHQESMAAFEHLRFAFWQLAETELLQPRRLTPIKSKPTFTRPEKTDAFLSTKTTENTLEKSALAIIKQAKKQLIISSFGWDLDCKVGKALLGKIKAGLKVIILARQRPKTLAVLSTLQAAGASVYLFKYLHAKVIWSDNNQAMITSANMEKVSFEQSLEYGLLITDRRIKDIKTVLDHWISKAKHQLHATITLGDLPIEQPLQHWNRNTFSDLIIKDVLKHDFGTITAPSADQLDLPQPKSTLDHNTIPAKKVDYCWTVNPPKLANNAKQVFKKIEPKKVDKSESKAAAKPEKKKAKTPIKTEPYKPPIYTQNNKKVVAITQASQIPAAQKLIKQKLAQTIVVKES